MIKYIDGRINKQLRFGYDVGKGYVFGEEEVRKHIDAMIDNKQIAKKLKNTSETGRLAIIRELGKL